MHRRPVPRDDDPDHAVGLADGVVKQFVALGDRVAVEFVGGPGVVAVAVDGLLDVDLRLREGFPVFEGFEQDELLGALLEAVGHLQQVVNALAGADVAPGLLVGLASDLDGRVDIVGSSFRGGPDDRSVGGVLDVEALAALARDELAVDEQSPVVVVVVSHV